MGQLLDAGADHSRTDSTGFSALHVAALAGRVEHIELLLAAGAEANKRESMGATPLLTAIAHKHVDCAKALVSASDLSITDRQGENAFHACVLTANEECFELLLPRMRDVDVRTVSGGLTPSGTAIPWFDQTPLHLACQKGLHRMAKALLKRGADRMARDSLHKTPLMYAAQAGHLACVVLLVGQPGRFKMTPAEVNATDLSLSTALELYTLLRLQALTRSAACFSRRARA